MQVVKRTFEANKHPKGSKERSLLNEDQLTSEYMTSYKYCIVLDSGKSYHTAFRSKAEADATLDKMQAYSKH